MSSGAEAAVEEGRENSGWQSAVAHQVIETPRPTRADVGLLREEIDTVRLHLR